MVSLPISRREPLPYLAKSPWGNNNFIAHQVLGVTERVDLLRRLYDTYRYMIAPTDFLYEAYETNRFYPEKLNKINFGINRELVKAYQTPRKKTDSRIRFGFIGQISAHKGVDLLINAYLRIKESIKYRYRYMGLLIRIVPIWMNYCVFPRRSRPYNILRHLPPRRAACPPLGTRCPRDSVQVV